MRRRAFLAGVAAAAAAIPLAPFAAPRVGQAEATYAAAVDMVRAGNVAALHKYGIWLPMTDELVADSFDVRAVMDRLIADAVADLEDQRFFGGRS